MNKVIKIGMAILLTLAFLPAFPAQAQSNSDCTFFGNQSSGALYCITTPPPGFWNGDLVIFAHGYVPVTAPVDIPWSQMTFTNPQGQTITLPQLVNGMGYGFATTSYSVNGLAVKEGIADILDLENIFASKVGSPKRIYLVGASEGGLITTLALERHPQAFSGGMELCGPVGSFTGQVNYWGDFRVMFDYFMDTPDFDVLPGNAVNVPHVLMAKWDPFYIQRITGTLAGNPAGVSQLLNVTQAPFDPANLATIGETSLGILWYNVFATNDAIDKLGGQPFDNKERVYAGSLNDSLLNVGVKRFRANAAALAEIAASYETSGLLFRPLVAMHTTGDPIVPYWHLPTYTGKVTAKNPLTPYVPITINRYGHCSFNVTELVGGFGTLVGMVGAIPPAAPLALNNAGDTSTYMLAP